MDIIVKLIITILLVLSNYGQLPATNYYFSNKGNDNDSGTTPSASWQSLTKLPAIFKSGDSILFERGSVFIGKLSISGSDIYIGAFGLGKKPIINGSVEINKWVFFKKNIWKSQCTECPIDLANVLINGKPQPLGRYPNHGYRPISGVIKNQQSFRDSTIQSEDNRWNQSEVVIRSSRWTIDRLPVTSFKNKTFNYSLAPSYPIENGFGYFIQNHLSTLDQAGEWYFDANSKELFIYLEDGVRPLSSKIEISFYDLGLAITNSNGVTIDGLVFANQQVTGCLVKNSRNIKLRNIEQINSGKNGIEIFLCTNPIVENSSITDSNNNGVVWNNNMGGSFLCNEILRTGLIPGRGVSGNGTYIALHITSEETSGETTLFQSNKIDSTGYSGIDFRTGHTVLKNNIISNFCMTKDDGGGIYTWQNKQMGNIIEGNTITNGLGSGDGTANSDQRFVSGIYIDDRSNDVQILNNKISQCATAGIYLHNARKITVKENTLAANGFTISNKEKGQLYVRIDKHGQVDDNKVLELNIIGNYLRASYENSYCIFLSAEEKQDLLLLGAFRQNRFIAHGSKQAIAQSYSKTEPCMAPEEFTLLQWQQVSKQEEGSSFDLMPNTFYKNVNKNLIYNGNMTNNIKGWIIWPEKQRLKQDVITILNNPSLNILIDSLHTEALVYHGGFSVDKDKLYRLTFTAWSYKPLILEFVPLMANSPWRALGDYICFPLDTKIKSFVYYFKTKANSTKARVNFKSNQTFWIDNVSLYEVANDNKSELPL